MLSTFCVLSAITAAKGSFTKALAAPQTSTPRVITVDKNAAYPKAFKELKAERIMPDSCELRQRKYLNNLIEQDHRFIKRLVKLGMGFFSLRMALLGRHPSPGLLFHSDRGSQYTSDASRAALAEVGITVSMSRTGNCCDNAVTESFFGTLKGECVERVSFQTHGQARQAIFEYVECFYNRVRRHSSLGSVNPVVHEQVVC
jgi:transposase-like protein